MHRNQDLYHFLKEHSLQLTEDWYNQLDDENEFSVYSSKNPAIVKELKQQNQDYFQHLFDVFIKDEEYFFSDFQQWSVELARDPKHLSTPLHFIVREYFNSQKIVVNYLKKFISLHSEEVSVDKIFMWYDIIVKAFDLSIYIFIQEYHKNTQEQLNAQKELINELSSPVIMLQNKVALLPLVGDIGTVKSQFILENTLQQCSEKDVEHLCIDLLGVATIDTMMAQEIFNLVKALRLIGVETILSGIRPEISQTAIRLGLSFEQVKTTSSLAQALNSIS